MNAALLAREAAAERGALDPKPEPLEDLSKPTRLLRIVEGNVEQWLEPLGQRVVFETDHKNSQDN
jgi:hypothetical protein